MIDLSSSTMRSEIKGREVRGKRKGTPEKFAVPAGYVVK